MPHPLPIPPPSLTRRNNVLDSHELHDVVDDEDMTYEPVADNRTSTQRIDELAAAVLFLSSEALTLSERFKELLDAVLFLTQKVNTLERRLESMQGD